MKITGTQILALGAVSIAGFVVFRVVSGVGGAVDSVADAVGDTIDFINPFGPEKAARKGPKKSETVNASALEQALDAGVS